MKSMQHITSKDGTPIAYEKVGQGPALILVGGALNDHTAVASGMPLAKRLAANFTVYSYDRRGRGESGDTKPYAIEREVEDIAALITNAGGSVYAYGMSSGGALALEATRRGLAIQKLAMYEPPFVGQSDEYLAQLQKLTAAKRSSDAVKLFLQTIGMPGFLIGVLQLTPMWPKLKKLAPSLVYDAMIMGDGTIPPAAQLAQVTVPTLVMTGPTHRMREAAHTLVSGLPNARQQVLEGQTHNVKPSALAPALATFFSES
jgi:pimeloyl-ACP methyl ester carboxylesterase